jgi:membrane dipeptidase
MSSSASGGGRTTLTMEATISRMMTGREGHLPIFDGHNDVLLAVYGLGLQPESRSFFARGEKGHLDLPRAREGGFAGGFFAVWVPPDPASRRPDLQPAPQPEAEADESLPPRGMAPALDHAFALRMTMSLTATLFRLEEESAGRLRVVRDVDALRTCLAGGTMAAILHFEGAEAIDPELNALEVFYRAGLRSLGLVWSRPNAFGEGVPFGFPASPDTGPGLTSAGGDLVRACNRLGIMIDLSHLNERGFWDVARISDAPLVATHSNAHAVTPTTRNLLDSQLDAVRDSDGVVGVNFAVAFTREDGRRDPDTPLDALVRHFEHLCGRMGVDHVAFGSDFDGAAVPQPLGDAAGLPRLVDALRQAGFADADLRKLGYENWLRVLEATWKPAS